MVQPALRKIPRRILGLSAFYHDSAATLVVDGTIVAAAQEERFTRKKHDPQFPSQAAAYCLKAGGLTIRDVDIVGFYEKPLVKFDTRNFFSGNFFFFPFHNMSPQPLQTFLCSS